MSLTVKGPNWKLSQTERDRIVAASGSPPTRSNSFVGAIFDIGSSIIVSSIDLLFNGPEPRLVNGNICVRAPNDQFVPVDRTRGDANNNRDPRPLIFTNTKGENKCFGVSADGVHLEAIYGRNAVWRAKDGIDYRQYGFIQTSSGHAWFDPRDSSLAKGADMYDIDESVRRMGCDPGCVAWTCCCIGCCCCLGVGAGVVSIVASTTSLIFGKIFGY